MNFYVLFFVGFITRSRYRRRVWVAVATDRRRPPLLEVVVDSARLIKH